MLAGEVGVESWCLSKNVEVEATKGAKDATKSGHQGQ